MSGGAPGLVVGLGNPGRRYAATRHNAGFMVLDELARRLRAPRWKRQGQARFTRIEIGLRPVFLLKPLTYMNLSGRVLPGFLREHSCDREQLLVVHDDKDLELGRLRVRFDGGSGGHKGVRSVTESLRSPDYYRLRLGIGAPPPGEDTTDYVLEPLGGDALSTLQRLAALAAEAVICFFEDGPERAMNSFNPRNLLEQL
jgi:PTH1 family peptidyl-tRNA hydrolase